jgi:hypothetical protein
VRANLNDPYSCRNPGAGKKKLKGGANWKISKKSLLSVAVSEVVKYAILFTIIQVEGETAN